MPSFVSREVLAYTVALVRPAAKIDLLTRATGRLVRHTATQADVDEAREDLSVRRPQGASLHVTSIDHSYGMPSRPDGTGRPNTHVP